MIISILLILSSCSNKETDENISKEKFILVLADLHKSNAILSDFGLYDSKLKDRNASYYNYVFKKYNITRAQFDNTVKYYSENLDDYVIIYDQVIKNYEKEEITLDSIVNMFDIPKLVLDSIEKINNGDSVWIDIWGTKKYWSIPEEGEFNTITYKQKFSEQCKFKLKTEILIFQDDSCINPHILLEIFYKDKTKDTFIKDSLNKDDRWHKYLLEAVTDTLKKPDYILCKVYNHDKKIKPKHAELRNISLKKYVFSIEKTDTIKDEISNKGKNKNFKLPQKSSERLPKKMLKKDFKKGKIKK
ncbi:MAG: DUF4296 domain-containing protein [Bacteroidales bacterium]|nr:DUF4296 domain-containing protein [Bacteroidales bacterium]